MGNRKTAISYDCTLVIKGIAILLMVFHHSFGFPERYVEIPSFADNYFLCTIAQITKICVPIFTFLTGWTYYHHKDKSIKYSAKKVIAFLLDYWIIVIPISIFAVHCCDYHYSYRSVGEFIPLFSHPLMLHAWYVWFYILMMLILPTFAIIEAEQKKTKKRFCFIIALAAIMLASKKLPIFGDLWTWFPCAISGYFIAKFRLLEAFTSCIKSKHLAYIIAVIVYISSFLIYRYKGFYLGQSTGYVSAPLFIIGSLLLYNAFPAKQLWNSLRYIGQYSMNIWFIHCIFSSPITRGKVQPIVYFWDNPLWIFFITVTISLALSIAMHPIQKCVKKKILPLLLSY